MDDREFVKQVKRRSKGLRPGIRRVLIEKAKEYYPQVAQCSVVDAVEIFSKEVFTWKWINEDTGRVSRVFI